MQLKKKLILDRSRVLFNEQGLPNVTIRKVAKEMNMSAGNLTYHFPKRASIVNELLTELRFGETAFLEMYLSPQLTKIQLKRLIISHSKILMDYRFFWLDYNHLENESSSIKLSVDRIMENRRRVLDESLAVYFDEFLYKMAISKYKFNNHAFHQFYKTIRF